MTFMGLHRRATQRPRNHLGYASPRLTGEIRCPASTGDRHLESYDDRVHTTHRLHTTIRKPLVRKANCLDDSSLDRYFAIAGAITSFVCHKP